MGKGNITGVVLAGGQSLRMGENKALLDYKGQPLLDHMIGLLQRTGIDDIYVSGDLKGYRCIPDSAPHEGPAFAMHDVLSKLQKSSGVLFVPVDMPFLREDVLQLLIEQENGGYFVNSPLPAFITKPCPQQRFKSVKELLGATMVGSLALPPEFEGCMRNTNTPEDWKEVLSA